MDTLKSFDDITENLKGILLSIRTEANKLKSIESPENEAERFFRRKMPKNMKKWRFIKYAQMMRLDKALASKGLPKRHFP